MTRKRFVKRMMGLGYSRNEANALAARARRYGMSYADRWRHERNEAFGRELSRGFASGLEAASRRLDELAAVFQNATSSALEAARKSAAALAAITFYKIDPADYAEEPAPAWPKENPYLYGLRTNVAPVDELAFVKIVPAVEEAVVDGTGDREPLGIVNDTIVAHGHGQILVGVDLANGPDMAAEITVVGGAENATD